MKTRTIVGMALAVLIALALPSLVLAQEQDAENCKDHPLLSRMKGYFITDCQKNFDAVEFTLAPDTAKTFEGQKSVVRYRLQDGIQTPSPLQIRRNYGNAVKGIGGKVVFDQEREATFQLTKNGKEIWIKLEIWNDGGVYALTVLEIEAMEQEVQADAMYDALNKDGFIALYINFDTGKSDIKPEAEGMIGQIVALLKSHADLKMSIEGHTDNVGQAAANKTLSEARAKAVAAAVVKGGVEASRVSAVGWGQERPIADNRTEDGRAKNRRVEIVKK